MNIGIIGNGFVGSALIHGFVLHVDDIYIYDKDPKRSTHSMETLANSSNIVFVCVPTPMFESGECDLSIVTSVIEDLSQYKCIKNKVIVIKSTVVPGTTENLALKYPNLNFVFNPEFLTERKARLDFINASIIVRRRSILNLCCSSLSSSSNVSCATIKRPAHQMSELKQCSVSPSV